MRPDKRHPDQLRVIEFIPNFTIHAEGSVLAVCGQTKVLCNASISNTVPKFLKGSGSGWLTAEYSMLPRSTGSRIERERNKISGRTYEIQRLIGRSLRAIIDLYKLGEQTITIDCDVLQADGGTRTTAINGSYVALQLAISRLLQEKKLEVNPILDSLAAVSVGIVNDGYRLDLMYEEDSKAQVDMNVIMTGSGEFVEIQGTGEGRSFKRSELDQLLNLAESGIKQIQAEQLKVLKQS